jgi:hypothetical protein
MYNYNLPPQNPVEQIILADNTNYDTAQGRLNNLLNGVLGKKHRENPLLEKPDQCLPPPETITDTFTGLKVPNDKMTTAICNLNQEYQRYLEQIGIIIIN